MFMIQPCQTIWGFESKGVMSCSVRVPKGTEALAFDANHLLVKHPMLDEFPPESYEQLRFLAFELCTEIDDRFEVKGNSIFMGIVKIGPSLTSYAVFAQDARVSTVFNIVQHFNGQDPERIAKLFRDEVVRMATEPKPPA